MLRKPARRRNKSNNVAVFEEAVGDDELQLRIKEVALCRAQRDLDLAKDCFFLEEENEETVLRY